MVDSEFSIGSLSLLVPAAGKQLMLATFFGLLIGTERAWRNKVASIRTFSMICAGSCLFSLLSVSGLPEYQTRFDPSRIAAQIITGVGFLGGGVIFKTADRIEGITTAAMIWLTAAIGMACGFNEIYLAGWAFFLIVVLDLVAVPLHRFIDRMQEHVEKNGKEANAG